MLVKRLVIKYLTTTTCNTSPVGVYQRYIIIIIILVMVMLKQRESFWHDDSLLSSFLWEFRGGLNWYFVIKYQGAIRIWRGSRERGREGGRVGGGMCQEERRRRGGGGWWGGGIWKEKKCWRRFDWEVAEKNWKSG